MKFKDEQEATDFIKQHLKVDKWVESSRKNHKELKALVLGEKFQELLVTKIEKLESEDRVYVRKKYSKDIRDLFERIMQPRINVFNAAGGSVYNDIASKTLKEKFNKSIAQFKGQKSLKKYLSEDFFRLGDTDPNGVIFVEYKEDEDIYPAYKSINDIRYYESNGQLLNVILFEPNVVKVGNNTFHEWRLVDDKTDWRFKQVGSEFIPISDKTFKHPFGKVPAVILSNIQKVGSEIRVSSIFPIQNLGENYARDYSILTLYKFQHGFPRHWRYVKECKACQGTGKVSNASCTKCTNGVVRRNDVTDINEIDMPRDSDAAIVTPNIEGFVAPDLDTWRQYKEDLRDEEDTMESTIWGSKRSSEGGNETATGRFIDVQPVKNRLDSYSDNVEWVDNQISRFVENWVNGEPKKESEYRRSYGRRFIIESSDAILDKYTKSRKEGDNNTVLDRLLDEYILSTHQNDPIMLSTMQKKRELEPYIHLSIDQTNTIFGGVEAEKKVLFVDWWNSINDKTKDLDTLTKERDQYFNNNLKQKQNGSFSSSEKV